MRHRARSGQLLLGSVLAALLFASAALLPSLADVSAQGTPIDPREVSLTLADLPRGFTVVDGQTAYGPLRNVQDVSDTRTFGVVFSTMFERQQTLENLQSGPIRVGQTIARSDDPDRVTLSLDAQREFSVGEHRFESVECPADVGEMVCLVRRDGPLVEYRIVALRGSDTLVSVTATGLPSAVNVASAIALMRVPLARYDALDVGVIAVDPPPSAPAGALATDVRAVQTPTPVPVQPTATPESESPPAASPTSRSSAPTRLPSQIDDRLAQPWSELMASTATLKSGEKASAFLRRVIDTSKVKIQVGDLRPNVGGELTSIVKIGGNDAASVERTIVVNRDVMNEDRRVIAAILAHEITHASQPVVRSDGKSMDCVEAEVQAYAVQAEVWGGFWGQEFRPGETKWQRSMNYVEETWKRDGERGLRSMVREDAAQDSHSCIG